MKPIYLLFAAFVLGCGAAFAQTQQSVGPFTVEYEKSVNTYAIIRNLLGKSPLALDIEKFEAYKKTQPQFKVFKSSFMYENKKSIFVPAETDISTRQLFSIPLTHQQNTVFTDFLNKRVVSQKDLSGDYLLLTDSMRHVKWKITDEIREVMGYQCRRANALILDSVYVVAFYTDDIHVSGGPELFSGLPGMILEVALPHDHVIWRASKITFGKAESLIAPPKKGHQINYKQMEELFKDRLKGRIGTEAGLLMKEALL